MKAGLLFRTLFRYTWVASIMITIYTFIFIYIFKIRNTPPAVYAVFVGLRFFVQGIINMAILAGIYKFMPMASVKAKRNLVYIAGYLLAFIFFFATTPLEFSLFDSNGVRGRLADSLPNVTLQAVMNNSLILIVHNLVILRQLKTNAEVENARLRTANLESTNLLLKQQIHPHFLFNALSMLKSLYKADVGAGEKYLTHLVNFLRASLAEPQARVSRLIDEIRLCNDYLEMQKIRFENALNCSISIPEEVLQRGAVPPFSIQSLIENAIKHNEVTESSPLNISVRYEDGRITVENNLQVRTYTDSPSGKGLINLIERYKILSGEEVFIHQDSATFSVMIKVLFNENSDYRG